MKVEYLLLFCLLEGVTSLISLSSQLLLRGNNCGDPTLSFSSVAERLLRLDNDSPMDSINEKKLCGDNDAYEQPLFLHETPSEEATFKELRLLLNKTSITKGDSSAFLNVIVNTAVMLCLRDYLNAKELITGSLEDALHRYWFTEYPRGLDTGKKSSGFQHVFQGEIKNGKVIGLHNWEGLKKKGYSFCYNKKIQLDKKGYVVETTLQSTNKCKTVFVETSPELEMALYTLCFKLPNKNGDCPFAGRNLKIRTFKRIVDNKEVIEASYPVIKKMHLLDAECVDDD